MQRPRMLLLEQQHAPRLYRVAGAHAVDIEPAGDRASVVAAGVPGDLVIAGVEVRDFEGADLGAQHAVDLKGYSRFGRQEKRQLGAGIERVGIVGQQGGDQRRAGQLGRALTVRHGDLNRIDRRIARAVGGAQRDRVDAVGAVAGAFGAQVDARAVVGDRPVGIRVAAAVGVDRFAARDGDRHRERFAAQVDGADVGQRRNHFVVGRPQDEGRRVVEDLGRRRVLHLHVDHVLAVETIRIGDRQRDVRRAEGKLPRRSHGARVVKGDAGRAPGKGERVAVDVGRGAAVELHARGRAGELDDEVGAGVGHGCIVDWRDRERYDGRSRVRRPSRKR